MADDPATADRDPSADRDPAADRDPSADPAAGGEPADRQSAGRVLVTAFGGVSLVAGLLWMLMNLESTERVLDLTVGAVLATGGLVLLMPHRIRLPVRATVLAGAAAAAGGTLAGLLRRDVQECCMFAYAEQRGFPYSWLHRGAAAEYPDLARELAQAATWQLDLPTLLIGAVLWAYAGILVLVAVRRGR